MRNKYIPASEPMSPDEVLDVMRALYATDLGGQPMTLLSGTPVWEWMDACDLSEVRTALNEFFGCAISKAQWDEIENGNIGNLCSIISQTGAKRQPIASFPIAGIECAEAGAFLAVRSALIDAGIPVQGARPSTMLLLTERQSYEMSWAISKLTPTLNLKLYQRSINSDQDLFPVMLLMLLGVVLAMILTMLFPLFGLLAATVILYGALSGSSERPSVKFVDIPNIGELTRQVLYHRQAANELG